MKRLFLFITFALCSLGIMSCSQSVSDGSIHIVTTGDVHGSWFNKPYVEGGAYKTSMMSVKYYVDSLRATYGKDNVVLIDAGDCLQGDNAAYYFNYVDTEGEHLFSRITKYMGYDAVVVGNHDIETGHPVYDKVFKELKKARIPFLAANAVLEGTTEAYFPSYTILKKGGMKVAVIGFTNPNMKAWLSEKVWEGIDFLSITPMVQAEVDKVRAKENPDIVILALHAGTGDGDGTQLESQGMDVFNLVEGVDVVLTSHDHRQTVMTRPGSNSVLVNGGARAGYVGHVVIDVNQGEKSVDAEVVRLDKMKVDEKMVEYFDADFQKVKDFTNMKVGTLEMDMRTRDAYKGMSDYINLVHTVQLTAEEAQISFAAPLTFNGTVKAGELIYNDMFTVYPFENELYVVKLTGEEIRKYLEYSYEGWIQTSPEHVLRIVPQADPRTGAQRWSFVGRSYNFDSAAGLNYTVDITKPYGQRVVITSLADGSEFSESAEYTVSMTSYRASGGGNLIIEGAGVPKDEIDARVVARYPAIRDMVYEYIKTHGKITSTLVSDPAVLGNWHFVPKDKADKLLEADMNLIF